MPTFEVMRRKYNSSIAVGAQLKEMSNMAMNETFSNSTSYRKGMIYDCYMNELEEIEFKFLKTKTYTIEKDQVEYLIQFRPGINPEIDYDTSKDKKHRFGFYIDILDENTKLLEKWLIIGKDKSEFDKYNILKCNWEFEWIDKERNYHKCLGCIRDKSSYNSGVWSDGFVTSTENQTAFIVPTNDETRCLDYGVRIMITDNHKYPKTYEITKLMDTFPLGTTKIVLSQDHYNEHTDLCEEIDIGDGNGEIMHMICDYRKSSLPPIIPPSESTPIWKLSDVNNKLFINSQPQVVRAITDINTPTDSTCEWHIFIDNDDYTNRLDELIGYFDVEIDNESNSLTISAVNKDIAKYIVKIAIYDENKTYYDFVEMEVCI